MMNLTGEMRKPVLLLHTFCSLNVDHLIKVQLLLVCVLSTIYHPCTIPFSKGQSLELPKTEELTSWFGLDVDGCHLSKIVAIWPQRQ